MVTLSGLEAETIVVQTRMLECTTSMRQEATFAFTRQIEAENYRGLKGDPVPTAQP